jgi:hypothetical protein
VSAILREQEEDFSSLNVVADCVFSALYDFMGYLLMYTLGQRACTSLRNPCPQAQEVKTTQDAHVAVAVTCVSNVNATRNH